MLSSDRVTTFAASTSTARTAVTTAPLPVPDAGAQVDLRGTLVAVHFRDERGFAIFSLEQPDGTRIRALGDLPADVTLRAVVRIGGIWIRHAQYGWQVRVNTFELIDHLDRRGVVAFLVAYTTHLGPVRAAEAVERVRRPPLRGPAQQSRGPVRHQGHHPGARAGHPRVVLGGGLDR